MTIRSATVGSRRPRRPGATAAGPERLQRVVAGRPRRSPGCAGRPGRARRRPVGGARPARTRSPASAGEPGDQVRVARVDLLAGQPARLARAARSDRGCPSRARSARRRRPWPRPVGAARLAQPRASTRCGPASASSSPDVAAPHSRATSSASVSPVRWRERRALGLAVVGQHDDLVRPRRPLQRPVDAGRSGGRGRAARPACRHARDRSGGTPRRSRGSRRRSPPGPRTCR